ncbi:MAG: HD domain-containing protein, partial [Clostridiales bacterium]|nr:HD domain-containing protein [Clostridiales bacterium]
MAIKTFAAINVGSYELSMKIFEISQKTGMRQIDHIRYRIDLGSDTYATGKISYERVDELCDILREFSRIMQSYKVDDYKANGTSAIRETENTTIVLDQIRIRTGIKIEVLSNSEQRFLDYKSIASKGEVFNKIIENSTAIVDIGGGSIQVSLFDKDSLVTTQNIRLGILRLKESLGKLKPTRTQIEPLVEEMVNNHLSIFKKLYLKDRIVENLIVVDDYVSFVLQKKYSGASKSGCVDRNFYMEMEKKLWNLNMEELIREFDMEEENIYLLYLSAILVKRLVEVMDAKQVWAPGVTLCDGIAYHYAQKNKWIISDHDFEKDIIACAQNISKRYMGSRRRGATLESIALKIFDSIRKVHGLSKRERLLLQISTLLHDCGKYISLSTVGECSYSIIMATEIIGLSHLEREIVANIVKYNHLDFAYYNEIGKETTLDRQSYLIIAKLTAILRVANGLDRSHKEKFVDIKVILKERELVITVDTDVDITLEKGLFGSKADFFEEVY